jgi:hypothetical protein
MPSIPNSLLTNSEKRRIKDVSASSKRMLAMTHPSSASALRMVLRFRNMVPATFGLVRSISPGFIVVFDGLTFCFWSAGQAALAGARWIGELRRPGARVRAAMNGLSRSLGCDGRAGGWTFAHASTLTAPARRQGGCSKVAESAEGRKAVRAGLARLAHNDVIQDFDSQKFTGANEIPGYSDVSVGWRGGRRSGDCASGRWPRRSPQ